MKRRDLLKLLVGAPLAAMIPIGRSLPAAPVTPIAPLEAFMPESWAGESLAILEENMVIGTIVHRDFAFTAPSSTG